MPSTRTASGPSRPSAASRPLIEEHHDELNALQILYNQPLSQQRLTYAAIRELVNAMLEKPPSPGGGQRVAGLQAPGGSQVRGAPVVL